MFDRFGQALACVPRILSVYYIKRSTQVYTFLRKHSFYNLKLHYENLKLEWDIIWHAAPEHRNQMKNFGSDGIWSFKETSRDNQAWQFTIQDNKRGLQKPKRLSEKQPSEINYQGHYINLSQGRLRNKFAAAVSTSLIIAGQSGWQIKLKTLKKSSLNEHNFRFWNNDNAFFKVSAV